MADKKIRYPEIAEYGGRTMGIGECPNCGCPDATFKLTAGGFAHFHCLPEFDGGCNTQSFFRSRSGTDKALSKIKKWRCQEVKNILYGKKDDDPDDPDYEIPTVQLEEIEDDGE